MTWMLTASGHAPTGEDRTGWLNLEHKLVAELTAVLSKPEYGAVSSWFRGIHVASSDIHAVSASSAAVPEDAPVEQVPKAAARATKTAAAARTKGT